MATAETLTTTGKKTTGIRWARVLAAGVLAEVAVIALLLIVTGVHSWFVAPGLSDAEYQDFSERAGYYVGPTAGAITTFLLALWVGRKLESDFVVNGVLVGLVGVVMTVGFLAGARPEHRLMYVVSFVLKIVAGYAAGAISQKTFNRSALRPTTS